MAVVRDQPRVEAQLRDYQAAAIEGEVSDEFQLAETSVVQTAVGVTSRLAERAGLLARAEQMLEQADVPLRAAEALFFYAAGVVVIGALAAAVSQAWIVGLVIAAVVAVVPVVLLGARQRKRIRNFEEELPHMLELLAGSLRAGFSFVQGLETVASEATGPMGDELKQVFNEAQLGRPIEDALDDAAARMQSDDLHWTVMAVRIQREAGGNLAELLDTVASTMSQRERLRAEIRTLTAEGRISGIVLGLFPFAFAGVLLLISPDYLNALFEDARGITALVISGTVAVAGFFWLRKIVSIEV